MLKPRYAYVYTNVNYAQNWMHVIRDGKKYFFIRRCAYSNYENSNNVLNKKYYISFQINCHLVRISLNYFCILYVKDTFSTKF